MLWDAQKSILQTLHSFPYSSAYGVQYASQCGMRAKRGMQAGNSRPQNKS